MALATERDKIAHLLRRAGFGLSPAELEEHAQLGLLGAVDRVLAQEHVQEDADFDVWVLTNPDNGNLPPPAVAAWWAYRMLVTRRPLVEKMTLFWHDHFACSAEKVKAGALMYQHNELLRRHALSDFPVVLEVVAKDPTMLVFLDGTDNVSAAPNENFARELMELYTMGIGNYSESDVQEAARAFTGWAVDRPAPLEYVVDPHPLPTFIFRPGRHDSGSKTVLGRSGALTGEDVLRTTTEDPATARNICRKLWEWFAYYDPDTALVDSLASNFTSSGYSTRAVLKQIFTHPQFYSQRAERTLYKQPADFVIGTLRSIGFGSAMRQRLQSELAQTGMMMEQMEAPQRRRVLGPLRFITLSMANMGQRLLFPPTVAGWDGGSAWINSATMIERIKFAEIFAPTDAKDDGAPRGGGGNQRARVPARLLLGQGEYGSAGEAVSRIATLLDAPLPADKVQVIADAVKAQVDDPATQPQQVVYQTSRLVFASPEYQFM